MSTFEVIKYALPKLLMACLQYTIPIALISFIIGMIIAVFVAIINTARTKNLLIKLLQDIFGIYTWIFRGTPLLVQLFIMFYGLPKLGIMLDAFPAAVITFALNVGAYNSEVMRASIQAIPVGQWEAGESLGMTQGQILRFVVLPQAWRTALPPLGNSFISLVKDTSLASSITIMEMFTVGQQITAETFDPLLIYSLVALIYLAISSLLNILQKRLEISSRRFLDFNN